MKIRVFDLETDGLYDEVTTLHSLVLKDPDDVFFYSAGGSNIHSDERRGIPKALQELASADAIIGHNIVGYDVPVLDKLYPGWRGSGDPLVLDTMLLSQLLWPVEHIRDRDFKLAADGKLPRFLIGRYSLEAWGYRLGEYKGDFKGPWHTWTQEMQDYCEQDVTVTVKLWHLCKKKLDEWGIDPFDRNPAPGKDCVQLEHRVAEIVGRQERRGVAFNVKKAELLFGKLSARLLELQSSLAQAFPPDEIETVFIPKANNSKFGYRKGVPFTRRETVHFNPSSRQQVAERLKRVGWVPQEFTPDGHPKVDDDILTALPYPEAKLLAEYYMVEKRLAQVGSGNQGWLRSVKRGRIHGRVTVNGAVTGRMTHSSPNLAQVPAVGAPYGKDCRETFEASTGYLLVGCDADALELRCLAHFLARYDGGAYIDTVLQGKKELGTDMHTLNAQALGCSRDVAKTWFYAFIYGAGDWKLGYTLTGLRGPKRKVTQLGQKGRSDFLKKLPAMAKLVEAVKSKVSKAHFLTGLDGRRISIRSDHAALNSLLQSAGALLMKRGLVILDRTLQEVHGLTPGVDYEFVLNIHDEWQIEVLPMHVDLVKSEAVHAIELAGGFYSFRCPLKGNAVHGSNWAETH